jgi:hypothetical protein
MKGGTGKRCATFLHQAPLGHDAAELTEAFVFGSLCGKTKTIGQSTS